MKKQPFNKDAIAQLDTKRSFHVNNVSICQTEENDYVNVVNPVQLADTLWTDEYKLNKLMKEQKKNQYLSNQIFHQQCNCGYTGGDTCCPIKP